MIQSHYNPATRIISTHYYGKIDMHEMVQYINTLPAENESENDLLYFEDQSKAEFTFKHSELKKIVYALYTKIKNIPTIRVAILNCNPKGTAFNIIAIRLLKATNLRAKIFSTSEAAFDWLLINKLQNKI
jgi:hypothetical protein